MGNKPKVYVATPCYDSMRVETCVSLLDTFSALGGSGIECRFKSVKSSLVTHGRNLLTAGFLNSGFDYMLFVDADVEFKPEAVMRMLVPKEFIVCTPYRVKEDERGDWSNGGCDRSIYVQFLGYDLWVGYR